MSWWWEYFENRGTDNYFANVKLIRDEMMAAGGGKFAPVVVKTANTQFKTMGVRCGEKLFIYAFNKGNQAAELTAEIPYNSPSSLKARLYDCESASYIPFIDFDGVVDQVKIKKSIKAGEDFIFVFSK
jgi:hypothetical protein